MKILHCCLSNFFIDGFGYQENIISKINQYDGNDVLIIASRENYVDGKLQLTNSGTYINEYGVRIIRLPYYRFGSERLQRKLRVFPTFRNELYSYRPDVVLFHGTCGFELLTLQKYKIDHPEVRVYVDSHEDYHNSARTWLSRNTLYRFWYTPIIRQTYKSFDKILYISEETKEFLVSLFGLDANMLEYFPLGGTIPSDDEYLEQRKRTRTILGCSDNTILCIHSGKLLPRKRTDIALDGFMHCDKSDLKLIIIGRADNDINRDLKQQEASLPAERFAIFTV